MGISWSSRRRHHHHHHHHHHHRRRQNPSLHQPPSPSPPPSSSASNPSTVTLPPPPPPPPPPSPPPPLQPPPSYAFAANAPYPTPQHPPQNPFGTLPPPSPPPSVSSYSHHSNTYNYARPMMGQSNYHPYYSGQSNGWAGFRLPAPPTQPLLPLPPYVDHQSAKKIKNDVNVHKDTIRVEVDEKNPESHLVSFTFDAMIDGSITIFYFAKEGVNCTFTSLYPEIYMPVRIPFQKGLGQKFYQPSGTGIDLGFFDMNDLSKPSPVENVFPLVIKAESSLPSLPMDEQLDERLATTSPHAQITEAVLDKNNEGHFQVRVIKQILWVDGVGYELREIYGISSSDETTINSGSGKECVICMTEPKDTAVLPCRHMCMCSECAKALTLQSNSCPICRQPIEELIEIKVNEALS